MIKKKEKTHVLFWLNGYWKETNKGERLCKEGEKREQRKAQCKEGQKREQKKA
jgi:hypothetical protein